MRDRLTLKEIADTVAAASGLDIRTNRKRNEEYFARMIYCKIASSETLESLERIGKEVNRNHATMIHALRKFNTDIKVGHNAELYNYVLKELDLEVKDTPSIAEDVQNTNLELLRLSVFRALKELSYSELSEFNETRLKPYIKSIKTRNYIIYKPEPQGALLR